MSDAFQINSLNRKSLLFEVVNRRDPGTPVEAFILTIPPEQMDIEEGQRTTITKTFGGIFVDDYGPDNPKINISGNTGSSVLRRTYALDTAEAFSGKTAFFYLRDHLMRYKERRPDYADYDIYLYDLSATSDEDLLSGRIVPQHSEGYVVVLNKFKMSRNKDKPLFYNYSMEFTAARKLGTYSKLSIFAIKNASILELINKIMQAYNALHNLFLKADELVKEFEEYGVLLTSAVSGATKFINLEVNAITYPLEMLTFCLGKVSEINYHFAQNANLAEELAMSRYQDLNHTLEMLHELSYANARMVVFGKTSESSGSVQIKATSLEDRIQRMNSRYSSTATAADPTAEAMSYAGLDPTIYIAYGYRTVVADETTTLEQLAIKYYGSPSFVDIIAVHNRLKDDADIRVGQIINIPTILKRTSQTRNEIYDKELKDVYGKDIAIDKLGDPVISATGDFGISSDYNNLIQALNLRLSESLGARLRLIAYGIRASIGASARGNLILNYILASIHDTVMQDPRILSISGLKVRAEGDILYISFDIKPIVYGDVIPYTGRV